MTADSQNKDSEEKLWTDALGGSPARDFVRKVFSCEPAMVKRELEHGMRMWAKYDPATYTEKEYEIVPGMWDHEHCSVCWHKILEGKPFWQNSQDHILCVSCNATFQKRS